MKKQIQFAQHGGTARDLAFALRRGVGFALWLILTLGSMVMFPLSEMAAAQALQARLASGYSPASQNTSNLPQSQVKHYDKNFIKNLKPNTPFLRCSERRELPEMSGNQHVLFMYQTLSGNTTQQAEGTVGSGITVSVLNNTSTIGNYADYVNLSHFARMTAIDPALENIHKELALRAALTTNALVRNTADGASVIDSAAHPTDVVYTSTFTRSNVISLAQSLANHNVLPFANGMYCGVISPAIIGDVQNDTTNNSMTDILKRTTEGHEKLSELPAPDGDEVAITEWGGVRFFQSTFVTNTPNYQGHGGTGLRTYIFGQDGVISISLGKKESAQIGDGDWRNLNLWMYKNDEPSVSDPSRVIGGWTSYNFYFTATLPPDLTMRLRVQDAQSAIS